MAKITNIKLSPKKICLVLGLIATILLGIYITILILVPTFNASEEMGVVGLFNVNNEVSIPTWFSQIILFGAAVTLLAISACSKTWKKSWKYLGFIFIYLSIDEGASIHELTVFPLRDFFNIQSGPLYYTWVLLFGGILLLLAMIYLKFFMNLPRKTQIILFSAALIFVSGAIGMEMVGSNLASQTGETSYSYSLVVAVEEYLEMIGVILFIYGLLSYYTKNKFELKIT